MTTLYRLNDHTPAVDPSAYVAPGARLIGQVRLAARASVWFNAVLRGDLAPIAVGEGSNIQDNTTVHVEGVEERADGVARGTVLGANVTVGHNCVIHGCIVEDDCLIGMGAVVMTGAVIGRGSIVGAGALVLEDTVVPPYSLLVGSPGSVKRTYPPAMVEQLNRKAALVYQQRILAFKAGLVPVPGAHDQR
ncbi:MAG TPA: gamma carbonic anhydrase family protein [bacterium]|nr:gamma carbonic anhydrase family protein [bacterium]